MKHTTTKTRQRKRCGGSSPEDVIGNDSNSQPDDAPGQGTDNPIDPQAEATQQKQNGNIAKLITLINQLIKKIQVLQVLTDNTIQANDLIEKVKQDITKLNEQLALLQSDGDIQENAIDNEIPLPEINDESIKSTIEQIKNPPQAGGWGPLDLDMNKASSLGPLTAADPMKNALSGTDVLLKSPDSFSTGSFVSSSMPPTVASLFVPQIGGKKRLKGSSHKK